MTHQDFGHHRRNSESVTHSKEDALSEREFELLWEGANKMDGYRGTEARFIVLVGGRLGLRAGEVAHFLDNWVNRREKLVEIPGHQECTKGKDGGRCGYCRQQIKQCVEYNGVEWEEVADHWWGAVCTVGGNRDILGQSDPTGPNLIGEPVKAAA